MQQALRILRIFLEKGELNDTDEPARFADYQDADVRNELEKMASELSFTLVEAPHAVYFVPDMDNPFLSMSLGDLRKGVGSNAHNVDAFLQCYIIMFILYLFFGGKNTDPKQASFLQIKDIAAELDHRLSVSANQAAPVWQENMEINFTQIVQLWNSLPLREDGHRTSREETVLKACRLMEKQNLLTLVDEQKEVRTTKRLDDLMINYYLSEDRVKSIQALFAREETRNA